MTDNDKQRPRTARQTTMPANIEDVDAAENVDQPEPSSSRGREQTSKKAGWFLSTLGYKGRSTASQHVKNWREGVLLEDESISGGRRRGGERRGSNHNGGSSSAENSVRAGKSFAEKIKAQEALRCAVKNGAFNSSSEVTTRRTDAHAEEIRTLMVDVIGNPFVAQYPAAVQLELARHARLETFQNQDFISRQGQIGSKIYVIVTGRGGGREAHRRRHRLVPVFFFFFSLPRI